MLKALIKPCIILSSLLILMITTGCSLQLVSDYDRASQQQMMHVAKQINQFYAQLEATPPQSRVYAKSKQGYMKISVELSALKMRQQVREMNELTVKQVSLIQSMWLADQKQHEAKNAISDFILKRRVEQYQRVFLAMIRGEEAKQISKGK